MAALMEDRKTPARDGSVLSMPVAGAKKIFAGALVARDSGGYAVPGATGAALLGMGRAEVTVDNTSGADGDVSVTVGKGVFRFGNDVTDVITRAHMGLDCYIVDDQTVASTDGVGTRPVAGRVFDVDSEGVWVRF